MSENNLLSNLSPNFILSQIIQYQSFLIFFGALATIFLVLKFARVRALKLLIAFNQSKKLFLVNLLIVKIRSIKWYLLLTTSYLISNKISDILPSEVSDILNKIAIIVVAIFFIGIMVEVANWFLSLSLKKDYKSELLEGEQPAEEDVMITQLIGVVVKILVWTLSILTLLESLGFKTGTIVGTLGIGGIAVAFAMQSILKDIFASASIFFDTPNPLLITPLIQRF